MTDTFKVWVQVERISTLGDCGEDDYENIGLPDSLNEFDTFEEATAFIRTLPGWALLKDTSDYREGVLE